ncbi:hypothetical protein ACHAXA_007268 [Cyclostephanos tholiformis]|uniref:Uncharacterized protein n=1 Tax=Cyclostephanos tholiformis TaxID=382380 RepID=A0ABD3SGL1_9STRA
MCNCSEGAAAGLSRLRLDETVEPSWRGMEEDKNLMCEDLRKQVILLQADVLVQELRLGEYPRDADQVPHVSSKD